MNLWHWLKISHRMIWLEYSLLSLAVLLPLLLPGYIFTLDMIFVPRLPMPSAPENTYILQAFLHYINYFIPSQIIQKFLLFLILVLSGVGMHCLVQKGNKLQNPSSLAVKSRSKPPVSDRQPTIWGAYLAGVFYMINPFTYTRFMAGHYLLLLGYALLPFFVAGLFSFLEKPNLKSATRLSAWTLAISIVSIHMVGFTVLLSAAAAMTALIRHRRSGRQLAAIIKYGLVALGIVIIASAYWLVPYAAGQTPSAQLVSQFDSRDTAFFQTVGDKRLGLALNSAALYGFWGDNKGIYSLPKAQMPIWPIILLVLFILMFTGAKSSWRRDRSVTAVLLVSGLMAIILSLGSAYGPLVPINNWLNTYLPFFKGYREPQKFVAVAALAEAYFLGMGLSSLLKIAKTRKFRTWKLEGMGVIFLLLPILYTPTMLWGFSGQVKASNYPADWYSLNDKLNQDKDNYQVLFLPWHQYMKFQFAGRVIANPADIFFDKPVIQGDNAEFGEVYRSVSNPVTEGIENSVLRPANRLSNAGEILASYQVKYIIVAKEVDWRDYNFLDKQADIKLISESEHLKVYQNIAYNAGKI